MKVKIIRKDIVPKYYVCEYNNNEVILNENIITNENICKITPIKSAINLEGKIINKWKVLFYIGDRKWICQCECGRYCAVNSYKLRYNGTASCGHEKIKDLSGKVFNEWTVDYYAGTEHGMSKWMCTCSCGKIKEVYAARLINGRSKSCGHNTNAFKDITNQKFGEWTALRFTGNHSWLCRCSCGVEKEVATKSLLNGDSKSCGHMIKQYRNRTMIEKYGETSIRKLSNKRSIEQINTLSNKELLKNFILENFDNKCTALELSEALGVNTYNIYKKIHEYNLEELIVIDYNSSKYEKEIVEYIKKISSCEILLRDRTVLQCKELDIYIPSHKLAIEFNGDYWHSTIFKDKYYHQQKTLDCAKQGIRLIHIFEHEWNDNSTKMIILNIIKNIMNNDTNTVWARNTNIISISGIESHDFLNKYHLQKSSNASISIGCYYQNELIGVMTFGKPRFNTNYEYELHRLCWKNGIKVIGGSEKLFKYFIKKYNPQSIITYSDISKFTGNVYTRLGFKPIKPNPITEPNYIWYNQFNKSTLTRYQTMKHKLIEKDIGNNEQTENEIMYDLDYVKVYDSGNIKLEWRA